MRPTIRSTHEIDAIFRDGSRAADSTMVVLTRHTPEGRGHSGRVAFLAGKKLGGSVVRNRNKRVLREVVRRTGGPWSGHDVVIMARPATALADPVLLDAALLRLLKRTGVLE